MAVNRSREAQRRSDEARIVGLTGASLSNLNSDPELSVLLALHAIDASTSLGQPVPAETVTALHWAMQDAGIEYPVSGGPTAVAASPFGVRGIFDLPLSDLTRTAREGVERSLTPEECERFLGVSTCPSLPSVFPRVIARRSYRNHPDARRPATPRHPGDAVRRQRSGSHHSTAYRVRRIHRRDGHRGPTDREPELRRLRRAEPRSWRPARRRHRRRSRRMCATSHAKDRSSTSAPTSTSTSSRRTRAPTSYRSARWVTTDRGQRRRGRPMARSWIWLSRA